MLEELCSLKTQPLPQPTSQIPNSSIPISLGSTPNSTAHNPIPPPTWGFSSFQPITTTHPSKTYMATGPSSLLYTPPPFPPFTQSMSRFSTSQYLPQPSSGSPLPSLTHKPYCAQPYQPPSPTFLGPKHLKFELPHFFGGGSLWMGCYGRGIPGLS